MKIDRNQSFYEVKVNKNNNKYKQNNQSGLKFRKALTTDTVSFSGMRTVVDRTGHLVDKFYLPKNLKANSIKLVMQNVTKVLGGGKYKNLSNYKVDDKSKKEIDMNDFAQKNGKTNPCCEMSTPNADRAYYFQIDENRVLDSGRINNFYNENENFTTINSTSEMVNILSDFGDITVNKAGNMTLIFPDSVTDNRDKKRNCVNQLGGKLTNITKMIDDFQKAGYHRLVLTPTTSDPMSSHKYWAVNLYQTDKGLGTEKDYDEMISIANKNGINIVSDAAFGKTGIASFQFQDVLLRGKASPYWDYYSINNLDNGLIDIGVLPEDTKNIGFKFVNNPNSSDYDNKKDTYVQIFDKRLVTDEEAKSNKLIMGYKNDNVKREDQKDFIGSARAVVPYYFPVNPNELKGKKDKKFTIDNLEFENYRITKSKYVGFDQWDGMQDLVKEKFYMDNFDNLDFNLTQKDYEKRQKGCWKVQDAEILAGAYSTKRVANVIGEDTVSILHKMNLAGKDASYILNAIQKENSGVCNLVKTAPNKVDKESIEESLNGNYKLKDLDVFANADDYITKELMAVPFETLDVAQSLMAVLSSSAISKRASVECEVGKSRFEVMKGYNNGDHDVEAYQNVDAKDLKSYKATDEMFTQILVPFAKDVLKSIETDDKKIFNGDNLTTVGRYAIKYMAGDIFRFAMYKALNPEIKPTVDEASGRLYFNLTDDQREGLNLRNINSFNREKPEDDALNVINSIKSGMENITDSDKQELADILKKRFENYDETSLKLASMLIDKAETGLDWRLDAAKDVSNINLLRTHQETYDNVMSNVTRFWNKFGKAVHAQNTHSYIVGEFTDMGDFVELNENVKYPTEYIAEMEIRKNSKMTSSANYSYLWGLQKCFCPDSAKGILDDEGTKTNPIGWLMSRFITEPGWRSNPGYANSDDIRNINQSYTFTENHDKPRILSVMSLDLVLFFSQFDNDEHRKMAAKVVNGDFSNENYSSIDFTKLNAKSIAMGYRLNQALDTLVKNNKLDASLVSDLRKTIGKLASSYDPQSNEAFGVKPINDAIVDVLEATESTKSKSGEDKAKIVNSILEQIIKPAASKYVRLYKMLSTLPGCTTDFLGTSMGMTGWEAVCKNPYQQCRGAIPEDNKLPEWIKTCLLNPIKEIQNMKQRKELNPLIDGDTHALPFAQGDNKVNVAKRNVNGKEEEEVKLASFLRYDQDGNVILNVYSFDGINNTDYLNEVKNSNLELDELVIYDPNNKKDPRFSQFQFKKDTKFKLEGDKDNTYILSYEDNGKAVIKKAGGGKIILRKEDMNTSIFSMIND